MEDNTGNTNNTDNKTVEITYTSYLLLHDIEQHFETLKILIPMDSKIIGKVMEIFSDNILVSYINAIKGDLAIARKIEEDVKKSIQDEKSEGVKNTKNTKNTKITDDHIKPNGLIDGCIIPPSLKFCNELIYNILNTYGDKSDSNVLRELVQRGRNRDIQDEVNYWNYCIQLQNLALSEKSVEMYERACEQLKILRDSSSGDIRNSCDQLLSLQSETVDLLKSGKELVITERKVDVNK